MSDQIEFDANYVKQLREEAAQWRTKYRELEAQNLYKDVEVEFAKRGIKADPTWVRIENGQSVSDAVNALVQNHPHLAPVQQEVATVAVQRPMVPQVMSTGSAATVSANPFHERTVTEIKKDPLARSKLRDQYRALLAATSNQPKHEY